MSENDETSGSSAAAAAPPSAEAAAPPPSAATAPPCLNQNRETSGSSAAEAPSPSAAAAPPVNQNIEAAAPAAAPNTAATSPPENKTTITTTPAQPQQQQSPPSAAAAPPPPKQPTPTTITAPARPQQQHPVPQQQMMAMQQLPPGIVVQPQQQPTMVPLLNHQMALGNERLRVSNMYNAQLLQLKVQIQTLTAALAENRKQLEQVNAEKEKQVSKLQNEVKKYKKRLSEKEAAWQKERKEWKATEKTKLAEAKKEWSVAKKAAVAAAKTKAQEKTVKKAAKTMTKPRKLEAAAAAAVKNATPNKHQIKWDKKFQQLCAFKQEHGHCNVTSHNKSHDPDLACWVMTQRTNHRFLREGKKSNLNPERIQRLRSVGFEWTLIKNPQLSFAERMEQLKAYKEQHGHVLVPQKCKDPPGLGGFVLELRRDYKAMVENDDRLAKRKLTPERMQALEELGFKWSLRTRNDNRQKKKQHEQQLLAYHL